MKMTTYTATAEEARAFLSGEKTAIIVPMEPQPSLYASKWHEKLGIKSPSRMAQLWATLPPFQPGQRVGIKEPWAMEYHLEDVGGALEPRVSFYYKSDYVTLVMECVDWRLADTMPDEAIRQWFVPEKVEAIRLIDYFARNYITPERDQELDRVEKTEDFSTDWNERYPQYPYDSNPWVWYAEGKVEE